MAEPQVAVLTRFWGKGEADLQRLEKFLAGARKITTNIYVAVNFKADQCGTLEFLAKFAEATAIPITPWEKTTFILALNPMIVKAVQDGAEQILIQSPEMVPTLHQFLLLQSHLEPDTLVVGARLAGHEYYPGKIVDGNGVTVPWNTAALWNAERLALTGFLTISDGPFLVSGLEEVPLIALHQQLWPNSSKVKMIQVPNFGDWSTEGWDEQRFADHKKKMESKRERGAKQLQILNLQAPQIHHI